MASFWDLLPAGLWPVQPFAWPPDPMRAAPGPQDTVPPQASAPAAPAFGWAAAPPAPANAPAYSGATDPNAFLGSFPDAEALDPARSARLLEDAQRAHAFALWAFGPPSPRPAQQIGNAAARPDGVPAPDAWPSRNAAALSADARGAFAANAAAPAVATDAAALPPSRADQEDAPVGNGDAVPTQAADAAQPPGLAAASGNPNIERQGARIRAAAAARQPPPAFVRAAADDFGHGLRETPLQVLGGARDAGQALIDLQNWAADHHVPLIPGIPFTPHALFDLPEVRQPESYTGGAVRAVSQFLAGFAAGGPAAEAAGLRGTAQMLARGAGADFFFRGGHDQRLADLIEQVPALKNPVTDYLRSDPNDSQAEGRLKNAVEGLGIGAVGVSFFRLLRAARDAKFSRAPKPVDRGSPDTQPKTVPESQAASALDNANYAQNWYDKEFKNEKSRFFGRTMHDVVDELRSDKPNRLKPSDIPIQYVVRDGHTLILNTRSSQILERAGIPRSQWTPVNKTGDERAELALSDQLRRNGLTSEGVPTVVTKEVWVKAGNRLWPQKRR